ncbi:GL27040 [Drosophila persimilis]|uniref:GL27040 n=1 Tax=Drosophila persimilis TaxID=7234 RepID=B4H7J8_DROPE|nr:GL27040 [Drosophila persimilis]
MQMCIAPTQCNDFPPSPVIQKAGIPGNSPEKTWAYHPKFRRDREYQQRPNKILLAAHAEPPQRKQRLRGRPVKPPPIVLPQVSNIAATLKEISQLIPVGKFFPKTTPAGGLCIMCNDVDSYRILQRHYSDSDCTTPSYTYQLQTK